MPQIKATIVLFFVALLLGALPGAVAAGQEPICEDLDPTIQFSRQNKIPDLRIVNLILDCAELATPLENLDLMERDLFFMWAIHSETLEAFLSKKTHTDPPHTYETLASREKLAAFYRFIQSRTLSRGHRGE